MTAPTTPKPADIDAFITRREKSRGQERGSSHLFLTELCDVLGVDHPDPPSEKTARN